mgnify:CR=1 FL=1
MEGLLDRARHRAQHRLARLLAALGQDGDARERHLGKDRRRQAERRHDAEPDDGREADRDRAPLRVHAGEEALHGVTTVTLSGRPRCPATTTAVPGASAA